MDEQLQIQRIQTCIHRSKEKQKQILHPCCGRDVPVEEFFCIKKNVLMVQPMCFECKEYQTKESSENIRN